MNCSPPRLLSHRCLPGCLFLLFYLSCVAPSWHSPAKNTVNYDRTNKERNRIRLLRDTFYDTPDVNYNGYIIYYVVKNTVKSTHKLFDTINFDQIKRTKYAF